MRLPRKIVIKGKTWKIKRAKKVLLGDMLCDGLMEAGPKTITVRSGLSDRRCLEVLLHEVIHAGIYELHLDENGCIDPAIEEVLCSGISDIFLNLFDIKIGK